MPLAPLHGSGGNERELTPLAGDLAPGSAILAGGGGISFDGKFAFFHRVEQLLPEALTLARRLASGPTRSLGLSKRLLNASFESDLFHILELEAHFQALATESPDLAEGMAAFREKRDAQFDGT